MIKYIKILNTSLITLSLLATACLYANDYNYYQQQFDTADGRNFIKSYKDFYQPHVDDSIINSTHTTIESALASDLRELTSKLYNSVIKKTLTEISAAGNIPWNSDQLNLLKLCINDKADYATIENQCVPRMLWAAGYQEFANCMAYQLRNTMNSCMGVNTSS
ncbi:MAG: hypothetical protein KBD64_03970 [Gammaproteobacteria bacterium]|nr:hypothetical protein [Gammaproteobacteria bacterium]